MRSALQTSDGSSSSCASKVSMTRILEFIDPTDLPEEARETLELIGSSLVRGRTTREISERTGRSEDWVTGRVARLRVQLLDAAIAGARRTEQQAVAELEQLRSQIAGAGGAATRSLRTESPGGICPTGAPVAGSR